MILESFQERQKPPSSACRKPLEIDRTGLPRGHRFGPAFLQRFLLNLNAWRLMKRRYGVGYGRLERRVFEREWFSRDDFTAHAAWRLQAIVQHAVHTVPYYRELFAGLGIQPAEIRRPDDLDRLPILRQSTVQRHRGEFISSEQHLMRCSTVPTGTGFTFPLSLEGEREQWAVWWRCHARFGINRLTWSAHFSGSPIVPLDRDRPPFWRVSRPERQVLFSGHHMTRARLPHYVEELNRRKPPWIQGDSSMLAVLASCLVEGSIGLDFRPRIVTAVSEPLPDDQKALIEEAFGAPCRRHFGMTGWVGGISECPEGNLHVDEDFAHLELLPVGDDGTCRIIGTGFANSAFPLIRYDTGVAAVPGPPDRRCSCGRVGRLVRFLCL